MALQVRRNPSIKVRLITTLMMVFALVAQPLYSFAIGQIAYAASPTTVVVNSLTGQGWELNDTRANGHVKLISDNTAAGAGALSLKTDSSPASGQDKAQFINNTLWTNPLNLSAVANTNLSYSTKQNSASFAAGLPSYQMEVNLNGATGYTTLVYEPYNNDGNAAVHANEWQSWNVGDGKLWSSRTIASSTDNFIFQSSQGQYQYNLSDILTHFPNAKVLSFGVNVGSNNPGYDTEVDSLAFNNKTYNFEPVTPTASDSAFVYDAMHIRENNVGDNVAQIRVPAYATDIQFVVDGQVVSDLDISTNDNYDNDIYKVPGSSNGSQWYRLQKSLRAGEHSVSAKFYYDGNWYPVTGLALAYSLDTPWAEYVLPQANKVFRPNDKVVRMKIDDQFNQFRSMDVTINSVVTTVLRSACVDQGDYVLCDVQGLNLPEGVYTANTTVRTQANNRRDNLLSQQFKIDATAPTVTGLNIENDINGTVGNEVLVSVSANDTDTIESVNFYITSPRADGVCDGNGVKLVEQRVKTIDNDGKYRTVLANNLNGTYCVTAVSRDVAMNNSAAIHTKVKFDNTAPTVPAPLNPYGWQNGSSAFTWTTSQDSDISGVSYEILTGTHSNTDSNGRLNNGVSVVTSDATGTSFEYSFSEGPLFWQIRAKDAMGNVSGWSTVRPTTIDSLAPVVSIDSPFNESTVGNGIVNIVGSAQDPYMKEYDVLVERLGAGNSWSQVYESASNSSASFSGKTLYTLSATDDGQYRVKLTARDILNHSTVKQSVFTVDNTTPVLTLSDPIANNDGTYTVGGTTTDVNAPIIVTMNGREVSNQVITKTDGVWAVNLGALAAGASYVITANASDAVGNSAVQQSATFAVPPVVVTPLLIPAFANINTPTPLSQPRLTNAASANGVEVAQSETPNDAAVLGTQTTKDSSDTSDIMKNVAAIEPSSEGWKLFGLAWYWWMLIVAAVAAIWYAVARRRNQDA